MSKRIPVKKKRKTDADVQRIVELFYSQSEARYRIALAAFEAQDEPTKEAIRMIRDRIAVIGSGTIRVFPQGKTNPGIVVPIRQETIDQNLLYAATEIVKDLAFMDIRVANYVFPKVYCSECGDKLTKVRKKKSRK